MSGTIVTLGEWAQRIGRSESSIVNHWRPLVGFPRRVGRRRTDAPGPGPYEYDLAELETWRAGWEARHRTGSEHAVPGDPDEYLTLGAIARRLGLDGRSVTQYRTVIEASTRPQAVGKRRLYRLGDVIEVLNRRRGRGVAANPGRDRRRKPR